MKRIKILKAYFIIWLFIIYVVWVNIDLLSVFFMATVIFSSAILGLLAVGALYQTASGFGIMMLGGTFGALAYKKTGYEFYLKGIDSILPANIAHMLKTRKSQQKMLFTQEESRNIIEWLNSKFSKQKSYTSFFVNTAMLVGLLGTFVGLVEAIDSMGQIILGLNGDVDIKQIMQDFSGPLSGMAIGFGASLFGVVCAVILGMNGYILFRSQDTLISGVEDWLKDRIIDIAPEALGRTTTGSVSELPEQRKSFIDIFLEQMNHFTHEISKLTKSNENFHAMSETLASMKTVMEAHSNTFQTIALTQANQVQKFDQFVAYTKDADSQKEKKQEADKTGLYALFETQNQLLHQTANTLLAVNNGVVNVNHKLEVEQQQNETMIALQQQDQAQHNASHQQLIDTLHTLTQNINAHAEANALQLEQHTQKFDTMLNRFIDMASSLMQIFVQCEASHQVLLKSMAMNEEQFGETRKAYAHFDTQMNLLKEQLSQELYALQTLNERVIFNHTDMQENHKSMFSMTERIASVLNVSQETLESLMGVQTALKAETNSASAEALNVAMTMEQTLHQQYDALKSFFVTHERFYDEYTEGKQALYSNFEKLHASFNLETQTTHALLQHSEMAYETYQKAFEDENKRLETLGMKLDILEQTHREGLEQNKAFETLYNQTEQEKQAYIVSQLSQEMAQTNQKLLEMNASLKTIEEIIARLDKAHALQSGGVASEIKGFFSSFFHKNSNEQ